MYTDRCFPSIALMAVVPHFWAPAMAKSTSGLECPGIGGALSDIIGWIGLAGLEQIMECPCGRQDRGSDKLNRSADTGLTASINPTLGAMGRR
jgi:hypothetical protein